MAVVSSKIVVERLREGYAVRSISDPYALGFGGWAANRRRGEQELMFCRHTISSPPQQQPKPTIHPSHSYTIICVPCTPHPHIPAPSHRRCPVRPLNPRHTRMPKRSSMCVRCRSHRSAAENDMSLRWHTRNTSRFSASSVRNHRI